MYCNVYCFLTDNVRLARRKLRHAAICILISAVTGGDGSDVMRSWCLGRRISYQPAPDAAAGRASKMILNPSKAISRRIIFFSAGNYKCFAEACTLRHVLPAYVRSSRRDSAAADRCPL